MERNQFFHARLVVSASCSQSGRISSIRPKRVPRRAGGLFSPAECLSKPCGVVFRGVDVVVPFWPEGPPLSSSPSSFDTCTNFGAGMECAEERAEWKDVRSESGVSGGARCAKPAFVVLFVCAARALSAAIEGMITSS